MQITKVKRRLLEAGEASSPIRRTSLPFSTRASPRPACRSVAQKTNYWMRIARNTERESSSA
jgi:hypothetical protein